MAKEGFKVDNRFKKNMVARFERYRLEAGVLRDKPHKNPKPARPSMLKAPKPKKKRSKADGVTKKKKSNTKKSSKVKTRKTKSSISKAKTRKRKMQKSNRGGGLGTMAGGPVRRKDVTTRGTLKEIANYMRRRHGIPYVSEPFKSMKTKDMKNLMKELLNLITGRASSYSKAETALRAVIRNPFLKKKYGRNSRAAIRTKTFDRLGIDTGQVFQGLEGRVRVNPSVQKGSKT